MKVLVNKNTPIDISKECTEVIAFFAKHNIPLEFTFKDVSKKNNVIPYLSRQGFDPKTGQPAFIPYYGLVDPGTPDQSYDITIFCWDMDSVTIPNGVITSFTTPNEMIQLAINQYIKDKGQITNRITHELMHCLCYKANKAGFPNVDEMDITKDGKPFYLNYTPDALDGNYARTFKNLQPYLTKKPMYKYFKDSEIVGLKPELVTLLDKAREIAGVPFKITSGYRDPQHNAEVGGVKDSAHETGLAVDLAIVDSIIGGKILLALIQVGFKRFGFYQDGHIHCDIDYSKPNPCYWIK